MPQRLCALALLTLWTMQAPDAQSSVTATFTGATVIDGTGAPAIDNGIVIVRNGRITDVGSVSAVRIPEGSTRIDLRGKTLLPGFVNAHGHVDDEAGLRTNLERQLVLYSRYGVTSVFSLGETGAAGVPLRDEPARGRARLFVAGPVIVGPTAAAASAQVNTVSAMKVDWVKLRVDDNLGSVSKMPREASKAAIERAHVLQLPVAAHIFYLEDAKQLLRDQADLIAHSVRDQAVDAEFIRLAKARDVCVVPTLMREVSTFVYESTPEFFSDPFFLRYADPAAVERLTAPERQAQVRNSPAARRYKMALEQASRNLQQLKVAGVRIAMGTDSGVVNRFQGYFEHVELELMVKAGLSPMEALVAATGDAAACMKRAGTIGTIQRGVWADLVVYSANPAADIRNTRTLESVWIAGEKIP